MANTYTQIYMHIIFAVGHRDSLIANAWREELHHYIAGACQNRKHHVIAVNGTHDHVHVLLGMNPSDSVATLVQSLKVQSSRWVNGRYMHGKFHWQSGYGAFSYMSSAVPKVKVYVDNQQEHHRHVPFAEEVRIMFEKAGVAYEPAFLMKGFPESL